MKIALIRNDDIESVVEEESIAAARRFYPGYLCVPYENRRRILVSEFLERFTQQELEDIYTAAKNNVKAEVMRDRLFRENKTINLDSQIVDRALTAMVNAGIITAARKTAILS